MLDEYKTKLLAYEELIDVLQTEVTDFRNKNTVTRSYLYGALKGLKSIVDSNKNVCGKMAQEQLIQRIDKMQKGSKSESIDVPMRIVSEQI